MSGVPDGTTTRSQAKQRKVEALNPEGRLYLIMSGSQKETAAEVRDGTSNDVDAVLVALGRYGKWQIYQCAILCFGFIPTAFQYASIVFIGFLPSFTCDDKVNFTLSYLSNHRNTASTNLSGELHDHIEANEISLDGKCDTWDSEGNRTRPCEANFRYGTVREASIASEWNLVCRWEYLIPLSQMILTAGLVFGTNVLSPLADKYGRRRTLVTAHWIYLVVSMLTTLSPNIYAFIAGRFLVGFLFPGVHSVSCMALIELFPKNQTSSVAMISRNFWALGVMLMCPFAYWFRDSSWRYLQLTLSTASLMVAIQTFFMEESVRWLFAVNKKKEARILLKRAAKMNNVDYQKEIQHLVARLDCFETDVETTNVSGKHLDQNLQLCDEEFPLNKRKSCGSSKSACLCTTEMTILPPSDGLARKSNTHEDAKTIALLDNPVDSTMENSTMCDLLITKLPTSDRKNNLEKCIEVCMKQNDRRNIAEEGDDTVIINETESENDTEPDPLLQSHPQARNDEAYDENSVLTLFRHSRLRMLTLSISYIWIADCLIYFGLLLLSPALAGDRFINVCLNGAVEIPGYLLSMYTLKKFRRKTCILWFHVLTGGMLGSATAVHVTKGPDIIVTALTTLGKLGASGISATTFLYGYEVFPTSIRGRAVGFCSGLSYAGTLLSPLSSFLVQFGLWIPTSVFVVLSVSVCILLIFLPETRDRQLPQRIADL